MTLPALPLRFEAQLCVLLVDLRGDDRVPVWELLPRLQELCDVAAEDVHELLEKARAAGCLELELVHPSALSAAQRALCGAPREDGLVVGFVRRGSRDASELEDEDLGEDLPVVMAAESIRFAAWLDEQRGAA